jgi:hypothetical protein
MPLNALFSLGLHGVLYVTIFVVTAYSALMIYHWFAFGTSKHIATVAAITYIAGAVVCVGLMGIAVVSLS